MNIRKRNLLKVLPGTITAKILLLILVLGWFYFMYPKPFSDLAWTKKLLFLTLLFLMAIGSTLLEAWKFFKTRSDEFIYLPYYEKTVPIPLDQLQNQLDEMVNNKSIENFKISGKYLISQESRYYRASKPDFDHPVTIELIGLDNNQTKIKSRYDRRVLLTLDYNQAPYLTLEALCAELSQKQVENKEV